jgi:hypothetical protein
MIGFDFHAPRVAGLPFNTQNTIARRVDGKLHRRPIRLKCHRQAVPYRLTTARHRASAPVNERYSQRSRFIHVALPIWIIGKDFHPTTLAGVGTEFKVSRCVEV